MIFDGRHIDLTKQIIAKLFALNPAALDCHKIPDTCRNADSLLDDRQGCCGYFEHKGYLAEGLALGISRLKDASFSSGRFPVRTHVVVNCHIRRLCPERLKVTLNIFDDGSATHAINVDFQNGNGGPVRIVGQLILDDPIKRDFIAIAGVDHSPRQQDNVSLAIANRIDAQRVRDAESSRFTSAKLTSAKSSRAALQIFAMHLKEVIEH